MLAHLSWATHNLLVHVQTRVGSCTDQTQVRETAHSSHETSIIFSQSLKGSNLLGMAVICSGCFMEEKDDLEGRSQDSHDLSKAVPFEIQGCNPAFLHGKR